MEETRTPIFSQQLSDLSTLTGKLIKYCDNISGESHKCFVLTLNYLLTTNRTTNMGGGVSGRHTGSLSWFSISWPTTFSSTFHRSRPSASKSLLCRMDWVPGPSPGTDPTQGTGGFHGRSQVLIYKMAIFFFHNSMLLHYQILSWGQYLIPEVLDVNERCFASGHWGLNQQL